MLCLPRQIVTDRNSHSACILSLSYASHTDRGRPARKRSRRIRQATAPSGSHPVIHIVPRARFCSHVWCRSTDGKVGGVPAVCGALQPSVEPLCSRCRSISRYIIYLPLLYLLPCLTHQTCSERQEAFPPWQFTNHQPIKPNVQAFPCYSNLSTTTISLP